MSMAAKNTLLQEHFARVLFCELAISYGLREQIFAARDDRNFCWEFVFSILWSSSREPAHFIAQALLKIFKASNGYLIIDKHNLLSCFNITAQVIIENVHALIGRELSLIGRELDWKRIFK